MEDFNFVSEFFVRIEAMLQRSANRDLATEHFLWEFCKQKLLRENGSTVIKMLLEVPQSIATHSIIQPQDFGDKNADFCQSPRGSISSSSSEKEEQKVDPVKLSKNQRKKARKKVKQQDQKVDMTLEQDLMFKHQMDGQVVLKFLNQRCLIQHIGFDFILIYSMEQLKAYVIDAKSLEVVKVMTVKDINLMSLCDNKVAQLTLAKSSHDQMLMHQDGGQFVMQILHLDKKQDVQYCFMNTPENQKMSKNAFQFYSFQESVVGIGFKDQGQNLFQFYKYPKISTKNKQNGMICRQIQSNFENMLHLKDSQAFSIKICHNALLIHVDNWIYICRFKTSEQAINFNIIMKYAQNNFEIRDTVDCNFFVLQPRSRVNSSPQVNIFYDTLNDKFVHHMAVENLENPNTSQIDFLRQNNYCGLTLNDFDSSLPYRVVKFFNGSPSTQFIMINTYNFLTICHQNQSRTFSERYLSFITRFSASQQFLRFQISDTCHGYSVKTNRKEGATYIASINKDPKGKFYLQIDTIFAF